MQLRLAIVVPVVLISIFGLLYLTYGNLLDALRVFTGIPFAWVGGIFALWLRDMPFSISAAVGFIAMSGVAVLDDMILVSCVRQLREGRPVARRGGDAGRHHASSSRADDDAGRQPRLLADGAQRRAWGRKSSGRWRQSSSAA